MTIYELDLDEYIVLQSTSAQRKGITEQQFKDQKLIELVLTNKRIIYVSEVNVEVFSNPKLEVASVPLTAIKIIDGVVQVKQVMHDLYGLCLQIQFAHGVEYWNLERKNHFKWVAEINHLLGIKPISPIGAAVSTIGNTAIAFGFFADITVSLKDTVGSIKTAIYPASVIPFRIASRSLSVSSPNFIATNTLRP